MVQQPTAPRVASRMSHHPTEYLRILYRRRWVAIPGFLLVFLSGAIDSVRTVPVYEARTQLLVEKDSRRATSINSVLEERETWYEDDFYPTQKRILESRLLAARTVRALDSSGRPEMLPEAGAAWGPGAWLGTATGWVRSLFAAPAGAAPDRPAPDETAAQAVAIGRFMGSVTVIPVRNSRMVELRYRSPDREFAARAVNELAQQYILQSVEFRYGASKEANDYLRSQLDEQREKVAEAEARLQQYKVQNNALAVDERQNIVVQKLTALNQELTTARITRMAREADYSGLLQLRQNGGSIDAHPAILGDDFIQKLQADLLGLQAEKAKMGEVFGENYSGMRQLNARITSLQGQIDREVDRKVDAIRTEFETAKLREASLEQALEGQKHEAYAQDQKALEYAALEREASSARQLYENLLARTNETGVSSEYRGTNIQVLDRAEVPAAPVLPQVRTDLMFAAFGGLLLALALAFGVEYLDSRIKSPDELKAHLGLPFLGMVPALKLAKDDTGEAPLLSGKASPAFSEAIRAVRTAVLFSSTEEGGRSIVITSAGPSEGKTIISSSLAITLAQAGQRTLVIDADMRRPRLHETLDRSQEPGLSNVLVGEVAVTDAIRATGVEHLSLLAAGQIPPNPAELLGSRKFDALLADVKRRFDWVVIDAPPVMPVTDAAVLAHSAGRVLFVVGSEMTPRRNAATAVEQLRGAGARFVGAVLNRVNVHRHSYYYALYYRKEYGKYYQRSPTQI